MFRHWHYERKVRKLEAAVAGFAVLLFGLGQEGTARLAAGWLGAVLGFWLR